MKIREKILMNTQELIENGAVTIAVFGDSVTHGSFTGGEIDYDAVYWNLLRKKINQLRSYVPINMINAGIGGTNAPGSLKRLDKQVLSHNPDLIIVCFGLNDLGEPLAEYLSALGTIFEKCIKSGADTIFMTPNMMNTYVAEDTPSEHMEYAVFTAEKQTSGAMDLYMSEAVKLAKEMGVTVCDCYSKWKELSKTCDTTRLLCNRINHPTKEMHNLFADSLFDVIFDGISADVENSSTMYDNK